MRVLHLIESLAVGGAEQSLVNTLPALQNQDVEVSVGYWRGDDTLRAKLECSGIEVTRFADIHKWNLLAAAGKLGTFTKNQGLDVIHAHLYFPALYTSMSRLLHKTACGTAVTLHNLAYAAGVNKAGLGLSVKKQISASLYPRCIDRTVAVSQAVADHYAKNLRLSNITVIHNGISRAQRDANYPDEVSQQRDSFHIVMPGRLVPEKGHRICLEAMRELVARGRNCQLTLAGGGPLESALRQRLAELNLDESVTITGSLSHAELLMTMSGADVIAVPSMAEGFGLVAIEAMALRKPIVVSDVGGLTEIVEHEKTGLIVPAGDSRLLAAALDQYLCDPGARSRFGLAGRQRVLENFTADATARKLRRVYEDIMSQKRASALPYRP
ncbi:MAG: glycosyltransferase family 4 protein [Pseudomonadota bacterium]